MLTITTLLTNFKMFTKDLITFFACDIISSDHHCNQTPPSQNPSQLLTEKNPSISPPVPLYATSRHNETNAILVAPHAPHPPIFRPSQYYSHATLHTHVTLGVCIMHYHMHTVDT